MKPNRMKRIVGTSAAIAATTVAGGLLVGGGSAQAWQYPNYVTNSHPNLTTYKGYIQIRPCYADPDGHMRNAYIRYQQGARDTGRLYTGSATSIRDCNTYSRTHSFQDSLDSGAPQTQFFYDYNTFTGSDPVSIPNE